MLKELRPWVSEALSPWFANRFFQDIDSLFDRFFGDTGYRSLVIPMTGLPAVDSFFTSLTNVRFSKTVGLCFFLRWRFRWKRNVSMNARRSI